MLGTGDEEERLVGGRVWAPRTVFQQGDREGDQGIWDAEGTEAVSQREVDAS